MPNGSPAVLQLSLTTRSGVFGGLTTVCLVRADNKSAITLGKNTTSVTHLAGYAAAGYTSEKNGSDSFDVANFNPIFHFQYGDRILWESELEIAVEENGEFLCTGADGCNTL